MIRDLKSQAHILAAASIDGVSHPTRPEVSLETLAQEIDDKIKPWKRFGAEFW
jgi:hypothetical protein